MPAPHALILCSGGLRSLVAAALTLHDEPRPRLTLLHVMDGRPNRRVRREYARKQAEALGVKRVVEVDLAHLHDAEAAKAGNSAAPDTTPLAAPQMLLVALAQARAVGAERVVWPVTAEGDAKALARVTEQTLLCNQLADLESKDAPQVDTPLAEFADRQVLELGAQLGVSWYLAWSCGRTNERPCGECAGCRRRSKAFDMAGMVDPLLATPATLRGG